MQSTQRSKSLALMFLLGAFLTGGALGFVADRAVSRRPYTKQYDRNAMREAFAKELGLTAAQQRTVDSIFDWREARFRELARPISDSLREVSRLRIDSLLDADQQRRFKIFRDSTAARAAARERARDSSRRSHDSKR